MKPERRCVARSKTTGEQCKKPAMHGCTVCRAHGGAAPQVRARAEQRVIEEHARALTAFSDASPITDPLGALANLAGEVVGWQAQIRNLVTMLNELTLTDDFGVERAKALVEIYERAMSRTGRVLVDIGKLNLDERMTRVSEAQLELLSRAVDRACEVLPFEWREPFAERLATELRSVA